MGLAVPHLERLALGVGHRSAGDGDCLTPQGFGLFWARKIRRGQPGRPALPREVRDLIRRMCRENPTWGAPRIHGELLKLGIDISESSVSKYMVRGRKPPSQSRTTAAAGTAFINSVGNLRGFCGPYMIGLMRTSTGQFKGGLVMAAGALALSGGLALTMKFGSEA